MKKVYHKAFEHIAGLRGGIFDSHCHYDDEAFDSDREELLDHLMSENSTVSFLMHASTDIKSAEAGIALSEKYERFYTSVGIHPGAIHREHGVYKDGLPDGCEETLRRLAAHPKVKAIGEIGLDYHYEGYDKAAQRELFEMQLAIAKELDLPVIIHCREATEDFLTLMKKHRPRGVVHCFSGSAETARELVKLGFYIGFTGALTYNNALKAKRAFAAVPSDRLLFETDCPYMSPLPYRGKRCYSEMIEYVAAEGESLTGIPAQQLIDNTRENAARLFGIA